MEKPTTGLRKRQQITRANRMMFLWIAGVSVVVGISIVLMIFLAQKIWFGEKVLYEKGKTAQILDDNLKAVASLKENINIRNTDQNLAATKLNSSNPPLQSVLDALPADANSTALASSLQTKLLNGVSGVVVETISVDPVSGETAQDDASAASNASGPGEINFSFSVSTGTNNYAALKQVLERLERSIRPFNVTTLTVEGQGDKVLMTVSGVSYYNPAKTVQLTEKAVKP